MSAVIGEHAKHRVGEVDGVGVPRARDGHVLGAAVEVEVLDAVGEAEVLARLLGRERGAALPGAPDGRGGAGGGRGGLAAPAVGDVLEVEGDGAGIVDVVDGDLEGGALAARAREPQEVALVGFAHDVVLPALGAARVVDAQRGALRRR